MKKITLVIMAAGLGSRYGEGIKQLAAVGPNGEIIMDYSIYDAISAGFNKIVFVIRKDFEGVFRELIGDRISKKIETAYAFQELDILPQGFEKGERIKPWGTGHAVICCKDVINEPFAVINADDYYGKEAFVKLYDYLSDNKADDLNLAMAGFVLKNTLSDFGTVTRGVCTVDENDMLVSVEETYEIGRDADNNVYSHKNGLKQIDENSYVSMNMWACSPKFIVELEKRFVDFLSDKSGDVLKKEYLLPIVVGDMLNDGATTVKLFETNDKWFGVTYAQDKELFKASIRELIEAGEYPQNLTV